MTQILADVSAKQNTILGGTAPIGNANLAKAVVNFYDKAMLDSTPPYLPQAIIPTGQTGTSIYKVLSATESATPIENVLNTCDVAGICADITTDIGAYLLTYTLPAFDGTTCCPRTSDYENFFIYFLQYCPTTLITISLQDNSDITDLTDVTLIAVGKGTIKVRKPATGTTGEVCILSICSITQISYHYAVM